MKQKSVFFLLVVALLFLASAAFVGAQSSVTLTNPLAVGDDFQTILEAIGDWLVFIGAPIAIFMIMLGGFWILTSGGKPEKIEKGKQTILWTVVGYGILLLGTEIAQLISEFFKKP